MIAGTDPPISANWTWADASLTAICLFLTIGLAGLGPGAGFAFGVGLALHWRRHPIDYPRALALVGIGLAQDLLTGGPAGAWASVNLLVLAGAGLIARFLPGRDFHLSVLAGAAGSVLALIFSLLAMAIAGGGVEFVDLATSLVLMTLAIALLKRLMIARKRRRRA